jgi:hypothetical protein
LAHFIAVHLRHVDIQQNQVRRIPRGFLERQEWVLEEEAVRHGSGPAKPIADLRNCRCEPAPADGARVRANHGGDGSGGRSWIADGRNIAPLREAKDLSTVFYALEGAGGNGWKFGLASVVPVGPGNLVLGDFNHDGKLDFADGNEPSAQLGSEQKL